MVSLHQHPSSEATERRGRWNWQRLAQGVWIVLALGLAAIFVVNLPSYYQSAQTLCTQSDYSGCATGQLTPVYADLLDKLHLPVAAVAICFASLTTAVLWPTGRLAC